jgi:hypothetical protein
MPTLPSIEPVAGAPCASCGGPLDLSQPDEDPDLLLAVCEGCRTWSVLAGDDTGQRREVARFDIRTIARVGGSSMSGAPWTERRDHL